MLTIMAYVFYELGRIDEGLARARDALRVADEMADRPGLADGLALVARGYAAQGDTFVAGRLLGAVDGEDARAPIPGWSLSGAVIVEPLLRFRGPEFDGGRAQGRSELLAEVVDEVLRSVD